MAKDLPSMARLRTIIARQQPKKWGASYVPAQLATVGEGPSLGELSTVPSRLVRRDIHCLSRGERAAALLALYHPKLYDLNEQFMLERTESYHPLTSHPTFPTSSRLITRGTLAIADTLGVLSRHPIVLDDSQLNAPRAVPYPYLGDLRLLVVDPVPRLLNWSVRTNDGAFNVPVDPDKSLRNAEANAEKEQLRHAIERIYHSDLDIPTHRIASDELPEMLRANLERACVADASRIHLNAKQIRKVEDAIHAGFERHTPPLSVAVTLARSDSVITNHAFRCVLWRLIWRRALRVDLWSPLIFDRPLRPEKVDVLDHYSKWFKAELA